MVARKPKREGVISEAAPVQVELLERKRVPAGAIEIGGFPREKCQKGRRKKKDEKTCQKSKIISFFGQKHNNFLFRQKINNEFLTVLQKKLSKEEIIYFLGKKKKGKQLAPIFKNQSADSPGVKDKHWERLWRIKSHQLVRRRHMINDSLNWKRRVGVPAINKGEVGLVSGTASLALEATWACRSVSGKGVFHHGEGVSGNHHAHNEGLGSISFALGVLVRVPKFGGEVNTGPVEPVISGPHNSKALLADLPHRTLARPLE